MRKRIELIDAMRGVAVCLMVVHHLLYDLAAFCGAPWWLFTNPVFDVLHYLFAGLFILLCGVSSNFSRSNLARGAKAMALALGITAVTVLLDMDIRFGVLHMLAVCMLIFGLTRRFWEKLPLWVIPTAAIIGTVGTARLTNGVLTELPYLFPFGFVTADFRSEDYFPLLPWFFVFLLGTWCGRFVRDGKLPAWFYAAKAPHLAAIGRKSLWIYVLHQPILYGLVQLGLYCFAK